jgi:nucleoid DNA-binding protein
MTITKNDLINETAIACGVTREYARVSIGQFFDVVKDLIRDGNSLELRGFGTFSPKSCSQRLARNLQTGELISLTARKSMSFKYSSELKAKITGSASSHSLKQAVPSEQAQVRELAEIG